MTVEARVAGHVLVMSLVPLLQSLLVWAQWPVPVPLDVWAPDSVPAALQTSGSAPAVVHWFGLSFVVVHVPDLPFEIPLVPGPDPGVLLMFEARPDVAVLWIPGSIAVEA